MIFGVRGGEFFFIYFDLINVNFLKIMKQLNVLLL